MTGLQQNYSSMLDNDQIHHQAFKMTSTSRNEFNINGLAVKR